MVTEQPPAGSSVPEAARADQLRCRQCGTWNYPSSAMVLTAAADTAAAVAAAVAEERATTGRALDELMDRFIALLFEGKVGSGIAKMPEEVAEFAAEPTPQEAADVLICLLVELRQRGHSFAELLAATTDKAEVNLARRWMRQPDGTFHHLRAALASPGETA